MMMNSRTEYAEDFVRRVLEDLGQKPSQETITAVAQKVARTIPEEKAKEAA